MKRKKTIHKYREPFDMASIPYLILFRESYRRRRILRAKYGKWATRKVMRICKGCGGEYSARDMRSHKCRI
jgi:hypothetical protein